MYYGLIYVYEKYTYYTHLTPILLVYGGLSTIMNFIRCFLVASTTSFKNRFFSFSALLLHMTAVSCSLFEKMKEDQNKPATIVSQTGGEQENNTAPPLYPSTISDTVQYPDLNV